MSSANLNLQKLQALLNSATNQRQRKMYESLIEKARQNIVSVESTPERQKDPRSLASSKDRVKQKDKTIGNSKNVPNTQLQLPTNTPTERSPNPLAATAVKNSVRQSKFNSISEERVAITTQLPEIRQKQQNTPEQNKSKNDKHGDIERSNIFQAVGVIRWHDSLKLRSSRD